MNQSSASLSLPSTSHSHFVQRAQYDSRTPENERASVDARNREAHLEPGRADTERERNGSVTSEHAELLPRQLSDMGQTYNEVQGLRSSSSLDLRSQPNGLSSKEHLGRHEDGFEPAMSGALKERGKGRLGNSRFIKKGRVDKDKERTRQFTKEMVFVVRAGEKNVVNGLS